jgi:hypothetical protein
MRVMMRLTVLVSLLLGAVGCGDGPAVKEPQKFAPMPDPKSMTDEKGNYKSLGPQSGNKMAAPLKK